MDDNNIIEYFTDTVMEAPHVFSAGEYTYCLYPLSLGKLLLLRRMLEALGMDEDRLTSIPFLEVVTAVREHRDACLRIIVLATCRGKHECFDIGYIKATTELLSGVLDDEDIATLIVHILTDDKTAEVMRCYGIDKETEAMNSVLRAKSGGDSMSFGGKTILGTLVDAACERYGWTVEYAVWGVSYVTLRLLMADRVNTVYLSKDERNKLPSSLLQRDEEVIMASRETMEQIKSMDWR